VVQACPRRFVARERLGEPLGLGEPRLPRFLARRVDHKPKFGSGRNLSGEGKGFFGGHAGKYKRRRS
jgi:hypothetical protein